MLHHISIFYALVAANVMIQTVTSLLFIYVELIPASVTCVIM